MSRDQKPPSNDTYVLTQLTPVRDRPLVDPSSETTLADEAGKGKFEVIMTTRKSVDGALPDIKSTAAGKGFAGMGSTAPATPNSAGRAVSGEDYTKAYLRRQQAQAQAQNGTASPAEEATAKAQEKRKKEEQETLLRARARDLQAQIRWWESQRETGQYDEGHLRGMISSLQSQLGSIPAQYWP